MKAGDNITINAQVLRIEGNRIDAQTPSGQLIQTNISNVAVVEGKAVKTGENKAILSAPETKGKTK